jgi:hypothetical protein
MTEYRASEEKDGIVVEMVVVVNSKVDVGFLLTNKIGRSSYVTVTYYDSIGNQREWKLACNAGDLNKSTGVLLSFAKPASNFKCCFGIKSVEFVQTENPSPKLYEIYSPRYSTDIWGYPIVTGNDLLWKTGEQKVIPVYQLGQGLLYMFSGSRDYGYSCPIPTVYAYVPPFSSIYQSARINFEMRVIDWQGSEWGTSRYGYVFVNPSGGMISIGNGVDHWNNFPDYFIKDRPVEMYGGKNYTVKLTDNQSQEITLENDGRLIYIDSNPFYGYVDLYHNDTKVATIKIFPNPGRLVIKRDMKAGDKLKFVANGVDWFSPRYLHVTNYKFNPPRAKLKIMCWYSRISTADIAYIQTTCVPEEVVDEYVAWLKGQGYNAIKIRPAGMFR